MRKRFFYAVFVCILFAGGCGSQVTPPAIEQLSVLEHAEADKFLAEYGKDAIPHYLNEAGVNMDEKRILKYLHYFVSHGANINATGNRNDAAFAQTIKIGGVEASEWTLFGQNRDSTLDGWHKTPLQLAARQGLVEVVQFFVSRGANVHAKYLAKQTIANTITNHYRPTFYLAVESGNVEVVKFFVSKGADIHAKDDDDETPLHVAAELGHVAVAQFLISKGADVHAKDRRGNTPLFQAVRKGHGEAVRFLVANGADVNTKNNRDTTPLHRATEGGHTEIVRFLVANGANVNATSRELFVMSQSHWSDCFTPLHLAARDGLIEIVQCLVRNGADVHAVVPAGETPLDLARKNTREIGDRALEDRNGYVETVEYLSKITGEVYGAINNDTK